MGSFRAQVVSQLGERREVGKDNGNLHHPSFFDVSAAARADIRIARTASYAEGAVNAAQGARKYRTANVALRGKAAVRRGWHRISSSVRGAALSMRLHSQFKYRNNAAIVRRFSLCRNTIMMKMI